MKKKVKLILALLLIFTIACRKKDIVEEIEKKQEEEPPPKGFYEISSNTNHIGIIKRLIEQNSDYYTTHYDDDAGVYYPNGGKFVYTLKIKGINGFVPLKKFLFTFKNKGNLVTPRIISSKIIKGNTYYNLDDDNNVAELKVVFNMLYDDDRKNDNNVKHEIIGGFATRRLIMNEFVTLNIKGELENYKTKEIKSIDKDFVIMVIRNRNPNLQYCITTDSLYNQSLESNTTDSTDIEASNNIFKGSVYLKLGMFWDEQPDNAFGDSIKSVFIIDKKGKRDITDFVYQSRNKANSGWIEYKDYRTRQSDLLDLTDDFNFYTWMFDKGYLDTTYDQSKRKNKFKTKTYQNIHDPTDKPYGAVIIITEDINGGITYDYIYVLVTKYTFDNTGLLQRIDTDYRYSKESEIKAKYPYIRYIPSDLNPYDYRDRNVVYYQNAFVAGREEEGNIFSFGYKTATKSLGDNYNSQKFNLIEHAQVGVRNYFPEQTPDVYDAHIFYSAELFDNGLWLFYDVIKQQKIGIPIKDMYKGYKVR